MNEAFRFICTVGAVFGGIIVLSMILYVNVKFAAYAFYRGRQLFFEHQKETSNGKADQK